MWFKTMKIISFNFGFSFFLLIGTTYSILFQDYNYFYTGIYVLAVLLVVNFATTILTCAEYIKMHNHFSKLNEINYGSYLHPKYTLLFTFLYIMSSSYMILIWII